MRDIDKLRPELARLRRFGRAVLSLAPDTPPVEVGPGDVLEFAYEGSVRHVRVLSHVPGGLLAWDLDKRQPRRFRLDKIELPGGHPPSRA